MSGQPMAMAGLASDENLDGCFLHTAQDDPYLVIEPHDGLKFYTPVGLGPGLDASGEAVSGFLDLGFGFLEADGRKLLPLLSCVSR